MHQGWVGPTSNPKTFGFFFLHLSAPGPAHSPPGHLLDPPSGEELGSQSRADHLKGAAMFGCPPATKQPGPQGRERVGTPFPLCKSQNFLLNLRNGTPSQLCQSEKSLPSVEGGWEGSVREGVPTSQSGLSLDFPMVYLLTLGLRGVPSRRRGQRLGRGKPGGGGLVGTEASWSGWRSGRGRAEVRWSGQRWASWDGGRSGQRCVGAI